MKKKGLALLVAVAMLVCAAIGGTLAWLTDSTTEVKNVFTTANIDVELTETFNTDSNNDGTNDKWEAQMVPGYTYTKDPKVEVKQGSIDCYLFVKFEENNSKEITVGTNKENIIVYDITLDDSESGWTQGTGTGEGGDGVPTNVWYRKVTSSTQDQSWNLLNDLNPTEENKYQVKINENLTKNDMPTTGNTPELVFTAYASQLNKSADVEFSAKEAWDNVKPTTTGGDDE